MALTYRILSETVERDAKNLRLKFEVTDGASEPPAVTTHDFAIRLPVTTRQMHQELVRQIRARRSRTEQSEAADIPIPADMAAGVAVEAALPSDFPDELIAPTPPHEEDEEEPVEEE